MKNIFGVYFRDVKKIYTNPVALLVAIGVICLPSLYAWFNIAASWDPYGNTDGVMVAVASNDLGINIEGLDVNVGDMVVDNLLANDQIGWQFVEENIAIDGVKSGEYYAAVIIPKDFSEKISSILTTNIQRPQIEYYVNEKKNAIAPKITDKGVTSLQQTINKLFVQTSTRAILQALNMTDKELQDKNLDPIDRLITVLEDTTKDLDDFSLAVDNLKELSLAVSELVDTTKMLLPHTSGVLIKTDDSLNDVSNILNSSRAATNNLAETIEDVLDINYKMALSLEDTITEALDNLDYDAQKLSNKLLDARSGVQSIIDVNDSIVNTLKKIKRITDMGFIQPKGIGKVIDKLESATYSEKRLRTELRDMSKDIESAGANPTIANEKIKATLSETKDLLEEAKNIYETDVSPLMTESIDGVFNGLDNISGLLANTNDILPKMGDVMEGMNGAISHGVASLEHTDTLISHSKDKLQKIIDELRKVSSDERFEKLLEIIRNDPELAGDFMSSPVEVNTNKIYPIETYGSAMAPFYSILAIWVGALVLAAIVKCKVEEDEKFNKLRPHEIYLSRYLLFMTMGILQALIICLGDLYGLGIQCLEPGKFILAGIFASIVFTLIIYTLTISFGDVGKAIAVVFMVIQVAGAGGTFPIEVTPMFFKMINPLLPFTFAIDAMRECIAGIYENAYMTDLYKLSIFIPISLVVGLLLRKPVIKLKEFFEERLEDTGVM